MRWKDMLRAVLAASLAAIAIPGSAVAHGKHHGRHCCARYAAAVKAEHPSYYWRLGLPGGSPDVMHGTDTDATYGSQVTPLVPGALACGNIAVQLSGAIEDEIWESRVVAGEGARTIAPGTAHFGIEIWVRPDLLDGNSRRMASRELRSGGYLLAARSDALVFSRFTLDPAGDRWDTLSAAPLPLHAWSYVVANYDADGVMRLYVNGALVGELASSLALPDDPGDGTAAGGRFLLGASGRLWNPFDPATHAYLEWDGALDEAAFYGPTAENLSPEAIERHWQIGSGRCGCHGRHRDHGHHGDHGNDDHADHDGQGGG